PSAWNCSSSYAAKPPPRWTARVWLWRTISAARPRFPQSPFSEPNVADHRTATLDSLVVPGSTVAVSDGAGMPRGAVLKELSLVASRAGGVRLLLGWCTAAPDGLDFGAFAEVRTIMGGYGLRTPINAGEVRYVPARFGTVPGLLREVFRPDVLVAPWRPGRTGTASPPRSPGCPPPSRRAPSSPGFGARTDRPPQRDMPCRGNGSSCWTSRTKASPRSPGPSPRRSSAPLPSVSPGSFRPVHASRWPRADLRARCRRRCALPFISTPASSRPRSWSWNDAGFCSEPL